MAYLPAYASVYTPPAYLVASRHLARCENADKCNFTRLPYKFASAASAADDLFKPQRLQKCELLDKPYWKLLANVLLPALCFPAAIIEASLRVYHAGSAKRLKALVFCLVAACLLFPSLWDQRSQALPRDALHTQAQGRFSAGSRQSYHFTEETNTRPECTFKAARS